MSGLAALGHVSRDVVAGSEPRPGGPVFYAALTLARLEADASIAASCAAAERSLLQPLERLGLPLTWYESSTTTAYRFHYEGDLRVMNQEAIGDPWTAEQALDGAGDARWVHVGALVRTDFSPAVLAALAANGRTLLVDGQGLVRTPALGPLRTDGDVREALEHVSILKVDDAEARVLAGTTDPERLRELGVPEVLLTLGSRGSVVITASSARPVPSAELEGRQSVDPTGAGDTFAAAYLVYRSRGAEPVEAAREATRAVGGLFASR